MPSPRLDFLCRSAGDKATRVGHPLVDCAWVDRDVSLAQSGTCLFQVKTRSRCYMR